MIFQIFSRALYINYKFKIKNKSIITWLIYLINFKLTNFVFKITFLDVYLQRNYNLWNDGFIIDFAQKKTIDLWIRKTIILTNFLFSDKYVFTIITKFYNDNLLLFLNSISSFEVESTVSMLSQIIFYMLSVVIFFFLFYIFIL